MSSVAQKNVDMWKTFMVMLLKIIMSKLNELRDKKMLVKIILEKNIFARNSDFKLMEEYLKEDDAPEYVVNAIHWISMRYDGNIFETLSRTRRKVQEQNPSLRATDEVLKEREENRDDFKEWALNN